MEKRLESLITTCFEAPERRFVRYRVEISNDPFFDGSVAVFLAIEYDPIGIAVEHTLICQPEQATRFEIFCRGLVTDQIFELEELCAFYKDRFNKIFEFSNYFPF